MYQRFLREFEKQGIRQDQQITEYQVRQALNSISLKNAGIPEFDAEVSHEIWMETVDTHGVSPALKNFIETMVKAEVILREQVESAQEKIRAEADPNRRQELLNDLFSYSQDHRSITLPFGLEQLRDSKQMQESKTLKLGHVSSMLFAADLDEREESTDLKLVLITTLVLLGVELICLYQKHHFFTLMGIFLVLASFILNYFERRYVIFSLGWLASSFALDIMWLVFNADQYWNPLPETSHGRLQMGFLKFVVFFVVVELAFKAVIFGLLFKYREITDKVKKKVKFGDVTFLLDGKNDPANTLARLLAGQGGAVNPFEHM